MKLFDLLRDADLNIPAGLEDCEINSVETNTQIAMEKQNKDFVFVCIKGAKYDPHNDIEKLLENGVKNIVCDERLVTSSCNASLITTKNTRKALALLARSSFGCPDKRLIITALTGTKGKTTISYMLQGILSLAGHKCGIIGSNGIIYGDNVIDSNNSTPGSIEYYKALRDMADAGVTHVITEVTSQALMQYRTYGTCFEVAAFTNLFPDHIGKNEHQSFEEYRDCKLKLFSQCKNAVINLDSEHSRYFYDECNKNGIPYTSFSGCYDSADISIKNKKCAPDSSDFEVDGKEYHVDLPGEFNISNALCAMAISRLLGADDKCIYSALASVKVSGRCERVESPCGVNIFIDYAHTGDSLENILSALKKSCAGKLYVVFGAGGDRSKLRRTGMGQAACKYADLAIITSDNPRTEDPLAIIADIVNGITDKDAKYEVIPKRKDAIYHALTIAKKSDTVLLAGKGAETSEEINGVKYPFDERIVVSQYYKEKINQ